MFFEISTYFCWLGILHDWALLVYSNIGIVMFETIWLLDQINNIILKIMYDRISIVNDTSEKCICDMINNEI